ncbi:MAG: Crp/Fnr family transcriptional regulator [Lewinellaceae bacterium]|nr:Crp/Fnr family transcriptional regulator [Lewinellaceae bacterium]
METHTDLIRKLSKLQDRNVKELLLATGVIQNFEAGTELLYPGQYIKLVPIVLSGTLKVLRDDDSGKEILLYFIRPGESCIMTLFAVRGNSPSMVRAIVDENAELLLVPVEVISQQLSAHRDWLDFTFALFKQRYEELLQIVNDIAFSRVDERLLDLLLTRSKTSQNGEIMATHQQLADDIGTAREVVSRLLKKLENEGRIATSRGKIKFLGDL